MRWATVASLATVLFKSYYRASRAGRRSVFSNPISILAVDAVLFLPIFVGVWYIVSILPAVIRAPLQSLTTQALISLPLLLTSGVILGGVLFELGTASGLASSESVNWLPVSPQEYVIASCLSLDFAYSPLLVLGLAAIVPLALSLGFSSLVPSVVILSLVAFFLGAAVVEALRSVMNRISVTVYGRSSRLGTIGRIVVVVLFFVAFQLSFQPAFLYMALSVIVRGVSLVWFVPMVWPSVALAAQLSSSAIKASIFFALSLAFAVSFFQLSAFLRARYWSPTPVVQTVSYSPVYVARGGSFLWLDPTSFALAMKELRSLTRRKEMVRYLAIPVMLIVVFFLPSLYGGYGSGSAGFPAGLLLLGEVSTLLPIMLSSISLGQEGRSIANIYMLPITPSELTRGKLFFPTVISAGAALALAALMQFLFGFSLGQFAVILVASPFIVMIQTYIGLGTGARFPDFTLGPRARYMTGIGFFVSFFEGFVSTLVVLTPLIFYLLTPFFSSLGLGPFGTPSLVLVLTALVGATLLFLSRVYCNSGVKKFLSDMMM